MPTIDNTRISMEALSPASRQMFAHTLNELSRRIFVDSIGRGWWDDSERRNETTIPVEYRRKRRDPPAVADKYLVPTKMMLMVSELSEAMEGFRKSLNDDHLPDRPMIEVEFADAIIRILDCAGYLDLDVGGALIDKLAYNATREDHKREVRAAPGGKSV